MRKLETQNPKLEELPIETLGMVQDFKDLVAWKLARNLRMLIYALLEKLPERSALRLTVDLDAAAQSIGANIAEGFGRYSYQENIQFCRQARGCACEVRDHLVTALHAGFFSRAE
jgi:four helix bundle protein